MEERGGQSRGGRGAQEAKGPLLVYPAMDPGEEKHFIWY